MSGDHTRPGIERRDLACRAARDALADYLTVHPRVLGPLPPESVEALSAVVDTARYAAGRALESEKQVGNLKETARALAEMALRDPLTGIANRRALEERLVMEWERSRRTEQPLALLMADVDMLKHVNDERGHAAGDELLKVVAARLSESVRAVDLVGRYGGDEFLVICPDTPAAAAQRIADKLIAAVSGRYEPAPLAGVPISVSIGWAARNGEAAPAELVREADTALYRAKGLGRGLSAREPSPRRTGSGSRPTRPPKTL